MEEYINILREFGSFGVVVGLVIYHVWKIAPEERATQQTQNKLVQAIDANTAYLKTKNGSMESHMDAQDRFMERLLNEVKENGKSLKK